ncbi:MAG: fructosamine kinase family protein [Flavobacteriales bacterium]|nr:fructosamine kinase family protein [Flavobacteriales bacterium]PCH85141.1 MAG: hypothetical protein COB88_10515 [Flavobacteriales bacterium]
MVPSGLREFTQELLGRKYGSALKIERVLPTGGGSINRTVQLQTTEGSFFLKFNDAQLYPRMFELEKRGLEVLRQANEILIPEVIECGEAGEFAFLLLEYIDSGIQRREFWEDFGLSLARLHKCSSTTYGLDHDNYIGSLEQSNAPYKSWSEFFVAERLAPQVRMAQLSSEIVGMFTKLYEKVDALFPEEQPALLHGDLWSGNYMTSADGAAVLIDPAVYYGHREMDIGMTKLFGGFSEGFYAAYNSAYPMEAGWETRVDICNLYPLMVHVNLFGGSYLSQVTSILRKYTG